MIIGCYCVEVIISDKNYEDLEQMKKDIISLPYGKYEAFRGDLLRFSPESNPNVYAYYEIIGHVPVADKTGKFVEMVTHVKRMNLK